MEKQTIEKLECYNVPVNTCCKQIIFSVNEDGVLTRCRFINGCSGNLQAVSRLVVGRHIDEIIETLKGIPCKTPGKGGPISCPDQLAKALDGYKVKKAKAAEQANT